MSKKKTERWTKTRHKVFMNIVRHPARWFAKLKFGLKFKINDLKKDNGTIIFSNHQCDFDGFLLCLAFNKPIYTVVTDTLFSSNKILNWLINFNLHLIPKHKGVSDFGCAKAIFKVLSEGGDVAIFAEGNRNYAEFQYNIDLGTIKLVKASKKTLIFFNFSGGTGIRPRWSLSKRKGPYSAYVKKRITPDEYSKMSDEELLKAVYDNLRVYDSENGNLYKSKTRAEGLERMVFVCPVCGQIETLHSEGNVLKCSNCGLEVEWTENLHFKSDNEKFKFEIANDWYQFQRKWVANYDYSDENKVIFADEYAELYVSYPYEKRKLISKGKVVLYPNKIIFGDKEFSTKDIELSSPIGGHKFSITICGEDYLVIGSERFNPLKYVLMFHRIDTLMKEKKSDVFYTIED